MYLSTRFRVDFKRCLELSPLACGQNRSWPFGAFAVTKVTALSVVIATVTSITCAEQKQNFIMNLFIPLKWDYLSFIACLYVSLCLSLSFSLSFFLSLFLSLACSLSLSISLTIYFHQFSLYLSLYLSHRLSPEAD